MDLRMALVLSDPLKRITHKSSHDAHFLGWKSFTLTSYSNEVRQMALK